MTTQTTGPATQAPATQSETPVKTLKLHKTTLLNLSDTELDDVRGGAPTSQTCSVRIRGCPHAE